jgi:hypothetical protein
VLGIPLKGILLKDILLRGIPLKGILLRGIPLKGIVAPVLIGMAQQ